MGIYYPVIYYDKAGCKQDGIAKIGPYNPEFRRA
jgi:hypothetical protein